MTNTLSTYAKDGVNTDVGDYMSQLAGSICKRTFQNSPYVKINDPSGYFRASRPCELIGLPEGYQHTSGMDGLGTKTIPISLSRRHLTASHDLYAMTFGDRTRMGDLPYMLLDQLDVQTLGKPGSDTLKLFEELILGFEQASKMSNAVLYSGEIAELGPIIGSEYPEAITKFTLCGTALAVSHPDFEITGENLAAGQIVLAGCEKGFRCNGISTARKAIELMFGPERWTNPDALQAYRDLAEPSVLYDTFLVEANGWNGRKRIPATAIAHLSGGGIRDKFWKDILCRAGVSAILHDLWDPPHIMNECAQWRRLDKESTFNDHEIYSTWHGGQGVLVVMDEQYVSGFIALARLFGHQFKECGKIVPALNDNSTLTITSKFSGDTFQYPQAA